MLVGIGMAEIIEGKAKNLKTKAVSIPDYQVVENCWVDNGLPVAFNLFHIRLLAQLPLHLFTGNQNIQHWSSGLVPLPNPNAKLPSTNTQRASETGKRVDLFPGPTPTHLFFHHQIHKPQCSPILKPHLLSLPPSFPGHRFASLTTTSSPVLPT
ncbi:hypothetical protein V6N13_118179 [Hibiscus sabdariffa]|uniref:Uncharacterized protein n=1 Tax=Hibiscus sabdariffa TaxID=183260 RepID=A0ABR2Q8I5_9ROSI